MLTTSKAYTHRLTVPVEHGGRTIATVRVRRVTPARARRIAARTGGAANVDGGIAVISVLTGLPEEAVAAMATADLTRLAELAHRRTEHFLRLRRH